MVSNLYFLQNCGSFIHGFGLALMHRIISQDTYRARTDFQLNNCLVSPPSLGIWGAGTEIPYNPPGNQITLICKTSLGGVQVKTPLQKFFLGVPAIFA